MPREDDVRISNERLFHRFIGEETNKFYAYQYERRERILAERRL